MIRTAYRSWRRTCQARYGYVQNPLKTTPANSVCESNGSVPQVKSGAYDMDANLALFRHYNFSPEKANIQAMATVLIKAQMQLPNHDFAQLLHLIPERLQEEQPVAALIALTQHLEGARFQAYWQAADSCKDILASVPGYYDAIRAYILLAISSTCQKFGKQQLGDSLMLDGAALERLVR